MTPKSVPKPTDVKRKITGFVFLTRISGVPMLSVVQAVDKEQAIALILASGRHRICPTEVHPCTLIPGHHADFWPDAVETCLHTRRVPDTECIEGADGGAN